MRRAGLDDFCFGSARCYFHRTSFWIAARDSFTRHAQIRMRRRGLLDRVARRWLAVPVTNRRTERLAAFGGNLGAIPVGNKPAGEATDWRSWSGTRRVSFTSANCFAVI